jgi:hypothetical protein
MQRSPDVKIESPQKDLGLSQSQSSNVSDPTTPGSAATDKKPAKKYHNGWTRQLENLVAEWADKASCYQWMHQKTEVRFQKYNYYFTIPVIIMSTLTGTANFATSSIVSTEEQAKLVTFGIGAISIIAGVISTVANFLRYAQGSEAHRVAAISWGKFQRFISIELSLHPNERMDAMAFLKMGRIELDRLIEQSPPIPPDTVEQFIIAFKDKKDIIRPEIAGGIDHTRIFDDRESRLAKVVAEAAYAIQQKKGLMRQLVLEDIDKQIVRRTREERDEMEDKLRQEILEVAREAALSALKNPAIPYAAKILSYRNSREEVIQTVPQGIVEKTKEKLKETTVIGSSNSTLRTRSDLATQVANIAATRFSKRAATTPGSDDGGPMSVHLEIVEEDETGADETQEKI